MGVVWINEVYKAKREAKHIVFIVLTLLIQGLSGYFILRNQIPVDASAFYELALTANSMLILIMGILYVASVFTDDLKQGTIKMSLVQPTNRYKVHFGKFLYVVFVMFAMQVFTWVTATFFTTVFYNLPDGMTILAQLMASLITVIVITSFLSVISVLAYMIDIPAIVVTIGILILFFSGAFVSILLLTESISEAARYLFVTEFFTLFFKTIPQTEHFALFSSFAILTPLILGQYASAFLFKKKDIHF